ncbi:MAG: GNAT family N-acetyltransferase [Planctomycetota bacterium]|nr:GNAT family N-acetyltransferase [Planctomycetota bacterium]
MIQYKEGNKIPLKELRRLYAAVRWLHFTRPKLLRTVYDRSDYVVSAWDGKKLVGVARAISDGVFNAYLPDVLVDPQYRRIGIARELVRRILKHYDGLYNITVVAEDEGGRAFFYNCGFTQMRVALRRMRPIKRVVMLKEGR